MKRSRILILGVAAGSAVLAGILAKGFLAAPPPERQVIEINKVASGEVLVAGADLPLATSSRLAMSPGTAGPRTPSRRR